MSFAITIGPIADARRDEAPTDNLIGLSGDMNDGAGVDDYELLAGDMQSGTKDGIVVT